MARRPGPVVAVGDVRSALLERFTTAAERYRPRVAAGDGAVFVAPYRRFAARLAAGQPVTVHGWQVAAACTAAGIPAPPLEPNNRYVVAEDGQLTQAVSDVVSLSN